MRTTSLTDDLTVEHGDVLPTTLIASTVRAAAGSAHAVRRQAPDR